MARCEVGAAKNQCGIQLSWGRRRTCTGGSGDVADGGRRKSAMGTAPSGAGGTVPACADRHNRGSHAFGLRTGKTKFPPPLLEAIDRCLRLRETECVQNSRELLEALHAAGGESPSAVSIEIAEPLSENAFGARKESASRPLPPVPESRSRWRTLGWMVLSILACCRERRVHPGQAPLNWFRSGRAHSRASTARPIWPSAKCTGSIGCARICNGR